MLIVEIEYDNSAVSIVVFGRIATTIASPCSGPVAVSMHGAFHGCSWARTVDKYSAPASSGGPTLTAAGSRGQSETRQRYFGDIDTASTSACGISVTSIPTVAAAVSALIVKAAAEVALATTPTIAAASAARETRRSLAFFSRQQNGRGGGILSLSTLLQPSAKLTYR